MLSALINTFSLNSSSCGSRSSTVDDWWAYGEVEAFSSGCTESTLWGKDTVSVFLALGVSLFASLLLLFEVQ